MLSIKGISFSYDQNLVIDNLTFSVSKSTIFAVIGESGCGKSTLLQLLYGLHDLNIGNIFCNDCQVLGPKYHLIPGMESMKYLAQDFDLMPYISVAENVGKYLSNIFPEIKQNRINELLDVVEMTHFAQTKVKLLSGGQMQRVALARVLALEPEVLLLDEPFSHIDTSRKNRLRRHLFAYLKSKKITTIIATHDTTDVLSFSDEVIVMKNGKIIQQGNPKDVYKNPNSIEVASLFDDVNVIAIQKKQFLLYPDQIRVVESSNQSVKIISNYFKGNLYLVEALLKDQIVFFNHQTALRKDDVVFIEFILN